MCQLGLNGSGEGGGGGRGCNVKVLYSKGAMIREKPEECPTTALLYGCIGLRVEVPKPCRALLSATPQPYLGRLNPALGV